MAKNTQEVLPRICRCESPEKEFSYPACTACWKCKVCGVYGGCDEKFEGFVTRIFVNNQQIYTGEAIVGTFKKEMIEEMKKLGQEGKLR